VEDIMVDEFWGESAYDFYREYDDLLYDEHDNMQPPFEQPIKFELEPEIEIVVERDCS